MDSNDEKIFELDEPAAKSHTPPGWPIRTIAIEPSGKAPKKYGPTTYRFGAAMALSVILPRRGWTLVKRAKRYAYFTPPPNQISPPYHISIAIPTPEECLALARRSYARGQSWMGQLGEWPAWYFHERSTDMQEIWRDPVTDEMVSRLHRSPPKSSLFIGEWGAWSVEVSGISGEFSLGIVPASPAILHEENSATINTSLSEGGSKTVELTIHERNAAARRLCIEHYGLHCQACGMNYEDKYGAIGADLIHVHHVTPLSAIGDEYQVDPVRDLVPLCASCHHVAHQRTPPYSIAEIRHAVETQRVSSRIVGS